MPDDSFDIVSNFTNTTNMVGKNATIITNNTNETLFVTDNMTDTSSTTIADNATSATANATANVTANVTTNSTHPENENVIFYAMGDYPYGPEERDDIARHVGDIPNDAEFLVHVGDIKKTSDPCIDFYYNYTSSALRKANTTVFIVPGDNDWIQCKDIATGEKLWKENFLLMHNHTVNKSNLKVLNDPIRPENFAFVHKKVLFIGVHLVNLQTLREHARVDFFSDDVAWVAQNVYQFADQVSTVVIFAHAPPKERYAQFYAPLNKIAQRVGKEFLLIHGNGHKWIKDRPFTTDNILRVQVARGKREDPLKVTVIARPTESQPNFYFRRRYPPKQGTPTNPSSTPTQDLVMTNDIIDDDTVFYSTDTPSVSPTRKVRSIPVLPVAIPIKVEGGSNDYQIANDDIIDDDTIFYE